MLLVEDVIKKELSRQGKNVSWLAKQMNCNRVMLYRIFTRNSIDTSQLLLICKIMHYNFFDSFQKEAEQFTKKDK